MKVSDDPTFGEDTIADDARQTGLDAAAIGGPVAGAVSALPEEPPQSEAMPEAGNSLDDAVAGVPGAEANSVKPAAEPERSYESGDLPRA